MAIIIMNGWREGLEKVSLTKLQVELLNNSLIESKNNVDKLLEGEKIKLIVEDVKLAKQFILRASEIGVLCEVQIMPCKKRRKIKINSANIRI